MPRPKILFALFTCLISAGVIGALALSGGGAGAHVAGDPRVSPLPGVSAVDAPASDGSTAKFAFLARQTSNSCGLQPAALAQMPNRMRLQGSCCFPMNLAAYQSQVRSLRAYSGIAQIARDPYDVPVSLAKRLLAYNAAIRLTPAQAQTYARGMRMSKLKGPCCCHCWRWDAFRGLSRYLIADRHWGAPPIAAMTELLEGCGGPAGD